MDTMWMREKLNEFDALAQRYEQTTPPGKYIGDQSMYDELHRMEPVIRRILRAIDPSLAEKINLDQMAGAAMARNEVQRGLGLLESWDELAARLAPDAPTLSVDRLHSWIWDAARTFWESGHFRAAVGTAASAITAHTQAKLGRRDIADDKLMQEAFSDKAPEPKKSRLRVPGDPTDQKVQSRQRGGINFGAGCFFLIRNSAAHGLDELDEQVALEQLAALSVLARLIDECTVASAP